MSNDDLLNANKKIAALKELLVQKENEAARYREELVQANSRLEKIISDIGEDLKIVAALQKILSPTEIPNIKGVEISTKFIAGTRFGGDYFDVFEHEDRLKFGVVMASSSGYAISALFLSVLIQMSSKIEARRGLSPELVLSQIAQEMLPSIRNQDEAHVFYAVLDRRNFELSFSSCGPIAAFYFQADKKTWIRLEPTAPALSESLTQRPLKQTLMLGPQDKILLCTQGIVQAKNSQGESFGKERILSTLNEMSNGEVHDIRNEIIFQVQRFSEKSEPLRDQTALILEVKDRVIKLAKK